MKQHDPDVVLSVHPLLNHISFQAIRRAGRPRALMTVITDLVDFHRGWTFSQADLVVAPTDEARRVALRRRVPAERVKLLGLPVDLRFRPPAPGEKRALRRRFGLDEHRFTVLVMGGGAGVGPLERQVRALAWEPYQWQVVVVCGNNEKVLKRLSETRFSTPTLVLGFVDHMPELMRACDIVVTKAGPGAIAEALATSLPLIITGFLPGQETPNVDYVVESGFGAFAPKESDLFDEVRVLAEGGPTWHDMSRKRWSWPTHMPPRTSPANACSWRRATGRPRRRAGRGTAGSGAAPAGPGSVLAGCHPPPPCPGRARRRPGRRSFPRAPSSPEARYTTSSSTGSIPSDDVAPSA